MESFCDIGLIGLEVMGKNIALNLADKNHRVAVFNRTEKKTRDFILQNPDKTGLIFPYYDIGAFVGSLKKPAKILLMIKAGSPVDATLQKLLQYLDRDDILIDGGNSHFLDTERRLEELSGKGIIFVGMGISGGEKGARFGPSMMPGGNKKGWGKLENILKSIAAVSGKSICCEWLGPSGSGHFVKMVHNGIEYAFMQIISEIYFYLKTLYKLPVKKIGKIFQDWNNGILKSFLIEITYKIMEKPDKNGGALLEKIDDAAAQKGTGKWMGIAALNLATPVTMIDAGVAARLISSLKKERREFSKLFKTDGVEGKSTSLPPLKDAVENCRGALVAGKIIAFSQGFHLIARASDAYSWDLSPETIANVWKGGCIIQSGILDKISGAYKENKDLECLFQNGYFGKLITETTPLLRNLLLSGIQNKIPLPGLSSALSWIDSLKSDYLPTNLIQAQRDFFGSHLYRQRGNNDGKLIHTEWT